MKRRNLLKTLAITPAAFMVPGTLMAAHHNEKKMAKSSPKLVSETEGLGKAFQYKNDATKAKLRRDKAAICGNCTKWNKCHPEEPKCPVGKPDAPTNPCSVFKDAVVSKGGWCMSHAKNG